MQDLSLLSSSIVYENPWLRVREDRFVRPGGAEGLYGVVEKDDFAVIAAVADGRVQLVEQFRYPVQGRYWELPQGVAKSANGDLLETARIELREETGFVAEDIVDAGPLFLAYGMTTQAYRVFVATGLTQVGTALEAEEEGLISRSFSIAEVERMIIAGEIRDSVTVAAFGLLRLKGLI
ncbi:NUDIX domain-containing protein [Jeongeupia chitinilytica]|uniref:GDP-mannose pyrophosphatase n=1 Tax=Jeongeupia chitinilytica TaxID=1041641 RepID=A0ABQ3H0V4_9NEIS|nr:NUDIX hydrolase [Jeongeupia chitinilytica]GHD64693.1 ADP-ribose pyrophosphatase [Jeongeupia chitinilytica]